MNELPLKCEEVDGAINISIGVDVLRFAAEHHPDFWDGDSYEHPHIKITDALAFAKEVVREINREAEDGSTVLTDVLDKAIGRAVENGCEGVDHENW